MSKRKSATSFITPAGIFILIFSIFGMILSLALWRYKVVNATIPCTVSSCSDVLTGEYSVMWGAPVALYGLFFYSLLALLFFQRLFSKNKVVDLLIVLFLNVGWIFTIYLRFLELTKIKDWCEWCWLSVLFMITITISFTFEPRLNRLLLRFK